MCPVIKWWHQIVRSCRICFDRITEISCEPQRNFRKSDLDFLTFYHLWSDKSIFQLLSCIIYSIQKILVTALIISSWCLQSRWLERKGKLWAWEGKGASYPGEASYQLRTKNSNIINICNFLESHQKPHLQTKGHVLTPGAILSSWLYFIRFEPIQRTIRQSIISYNTEKVPEQSFETYLESHLNGHACC